MCCLITIANQQAHVILERMPTCLIIFLATFSLIPKHNSAYTSLLGGRIGENVVRPQADSAKESCLFNRLCIFYLMSQPIINLLHINVSLLSISFRYRRNLLLNYHRTWNLFSQLSSVQFELSRLLVWLLIRIKKFIRRPQVTCTWQPFENKWTL